MKKLLALVFTAGFLSILPITVRAAENTELITERINCTAQVAAPYDVSITKKVSVNGGAFLDSNTLATAPTGYVGDSVVWQITVKNSVADSSEIYVQDLVPSEFIVLSSDSTDFSALTGIWKISNSALQNVLTITTKATKSGQYTNMAQLGCMIYDRQENRVFSSGYDDSNNSNNSDVAVVVIELKPPKAPEVLGDSTTVANPPANTGKVLAAETLSNTGSNNAVGTVVAFAIIAISTILFVFSRSNYIKKS